MLLLLYPGPPGSMNHKAFKSAFPHCLGGSAWLRLLYPACYQSCRRSTEFHKSQKTLPQLWKSPTTSSNRPGSGGAAYLLLRQVRVGLAVLSVLPLAELQSEYWASRIRQLCERCPKTSSIRQRFFDGAQVPFYHVRVELAVRRRSCILGIAADSTG